jgi:hypothetical protein
VGEFDPNDVCDVRLFVSPLHSDIADERGFLCTELAAEEIRLRHDCIAIEQRGAIGLAAFFFIAGFIR